MTRRPTVATALLFAVSLGLPWHSASAQTYPDKPVRIVVPYVAGGNLDVTTRLFAEGLATELGQPFFVENRPGANGNTGTAQVARTPPDGYTLAMVSVGTMAINPAMYRNMGFDTEKDLAPISIVSTAPMALVANNSMPFRNMAELVAYAKANPGKLNFGSGGIGSLAHLSAEMLRVRTGVDIVHVPYKGAALALNDAMAGTIQVVFDTLNTSAPLIKDGRLRAIAVTSGKRSAAFPNVPTIGEAGINDYIAETWAGLVAPAGTPRETIMRIQTSIARIAAREPTQARLAATGSEAVANTPEQFATTLRADRARWAEIVMVSGARAE